MLVSFQCIELPFISISTSRKGPGIYWWCIDTVLPRMGWHGSGIIAGKQLFRSHISPISFHWNKTFKLLFLIHVIEADKIKGTYLNFVVIKKYFPYQQESVIFRNGNYANSWQPLKLQAYLTRHRTNSVWTHLCGIRLSGCSLIPWWHYGCSLVRMSVSFQSDQLPLSSLYNARKGSGCYWWCITTTPPPTGRDDMDQSSSHEID